MNCSITFNMRFDENTVFVILCTNYASVMAYESFICKEIPQGQECYIKFVAPPLILSEWFNSYGVSQDIIRLQTYISDHGSCDFYLEKEILADAIKMSSFEDLMIISPAPAHSAPGGSGT
ncbi:hypothetical protein OROGR_031825 [Orobanche gracilis]